MTDDVNGTNGRIRCIEDILQQTKWGLYNNIVLFFSLFCAFCCSAALSTNIFALPVAICDIRLSKKAVIWINAILPLGMGVGFLAFGILSDLVSRKFLLSFSLVLIFISSFGCGFCGEFFMYLTFTFVLGASTSANLAYTKINLGEMLPIKYRGYYLVLIDVFWIFGYLASSSINWAIRSRCSVEYDYSDHYTSWRMLFGLGSILSLFCICLHGLIQPSPRMLLATSRKLEAYLILKYIFSINSSDHGDNFKVTPNDLDHLVNDLEIDREYMSTCRDQCLFAKFKFNKIIPILFQRNILIIIFVGTIIRSSLFSGYGMANIWLLQSLHINITDCRMSSLQILHLSDVEAIIKDCDYLIPASLYRDFIFIGSSGFIGLIFFCYMVDKCGRHIPLSVSLIFCGIASANFIFVESYTYRYLLAVTYMTGFAISNTALDIIIIENLPTCVRSTGLGITLFLPNLEAFVFRLFFNSECSIYYYLVGATTIAVGIVGYFLPDRKRRPMRE